MSRLSIASDNIFTNLSLIIDVSLFGDPLGLGIFNSIDINYDVYYYDSELGTVLEEHIKSSNLVKDNQNKIFISDLDASFIEDALFQLFVNLQFEFEEIVINKLLEEGYKE